MTVREALFEGRRALEGHETDTPALDASLLLAHSRGLSRQKLYMELGDELGEEELISFRKSMDRRLSGEPVAWIVGTREFWGLDFAVGPGVLCPRPDSEILIESALEIMDGMTSGPAAVREPSLHDCCCGPGTLGLTLAAERPRWNISASDISTEAGKYFHKNNMEIAGGRVDFTPSDLMEDIDGPFDIIVSNPPYLTPAETGGRIERGWKEPPIALNGGGNDGLDLIRRLIPRVSGKLKPDGIFIVEADPLQMPLIGEILSDAGFSDSRILRDMGMRDRIIISRKTGAP